MRTTYGLTDEQHSAVGKLVADAGVIVRKPAPARPRRSSTGGDVLRLMIVDDEYPVYAPKQIRKAALFVASFDTDQTTVQMFGSDLSGYLELNIGGTIRRAHCQATTDELRAALRLDPGFCRVSAFPGLWEFAWAGDALPLSVVPYSNFFGGVVVTDELWVSDTEDGLNPVLVDVVDAIPFIEGQVKRGAVSIGSPYGDGYFVAQYWNCPGFSFGAP